MNASQTMNDTRIVIVGFMGCGKTEVAKELANELGEGWVDLDAAIEAHERRTPAEIIMNDGEAGFREVETAMLEKLLTSSAQRVIALGGGAWAAQRNRDLVRKHKGVAVWMDAPFELCWTRIKADEHARPLASTRDAALALYSERRPIYSLADLTVGVADEAPSEIAKTIAALLRQELLS
jgi:shikimate kinase